MSPNNFYSGCIMKTMEKALLIFADLDKTVTPLGLSGIQDLIDTVKQIAQKEKVAVKVIPISGRPADYVLGFMHTMRDIFQEAGLNDVFDLGAGEHGALVVDGKKSYQQVYLGKPGGENLKKSIANIIKNSRYSDKLIDEENKRYTCSIHIKKELAKNMTLDEQKVIYNSIKKDILAVHGDSLTISKAHDCTEVMPKEISKANAIKWLINENMKKHEIVGLTFSGDSGNDLDAIKYMSKLAEIPGIKANVFLPGNAIREIESDFVEAWKNNNQASSKNRIQKGEQPYFKGVTELLRKALREGTLVSKGLSKYETKDDLALLPKMRPAVSKNNKERGINI